MKMRIQMYARFERFWHWLQAFLIIVLLITGFEIHGSLKLLGFSQAHQVHLFCGWSLIILGAFAIFWHATTGEWKQYVPTLENLDKIARYYVCDIFKGESHPHCKTREQKLNPLQRLAYLALKIFILPLQIISGLWYYYYNQWPAFGLTGSLETAALVHTAAAFMVLAFLIMHTYLSTTGGTLFSYIKAMITGWEEVEE